MARRKRAVAEGATLDITSTIDVVFLLLIFFIATIRMPKPEADIRAFLPREEEKVSDGAGASADEKTEDMDTIRIALRSGSRGTDVYLNGRLLRRGLRALNSRLAALNRVRNKAIETKVVLAADRTAPYLYVVRALNLCGVNGFSDVSFAMPPKGKGGPHQ